MHETPERKLETVPPGSGTDWTFQLVPFQRSTRANRLLSLFMNPTAVHAVAAVHDTSTSSPGTAPRGKGVGWIVQLVPFQRSASVNGLPIIAVGLEAKDPTAVHSLGAVQDTPLKPLCCWSATLRETWMVHVVPFQPSARVAVEVAPTASHTVAAVQDTLFNLLEVAPVGSTVVWIVQEVPFHRSASVRVVLPSDQDPTAVHARLEVQDTPSNLDSTVPIGRAVCTFQLVPFQRSARGTVVSELFWKNPTAVQFVADVQETSVSEALWAPVGLGPVWILQVVPFQRSASAAVEPVLKSEVPTAVQFVADVHETASNELSAPPLGLGVDCIAQLVPFQRSARVDSVALIPLPLAKAPTAMQAAADVHDTPASPLKDAPTGLGVGMDGASQAVPSQIAVNARLPA